MEESFFQVETLVIELLLIISLVAIAVQRLRVPYTVALVTVGLSLSLLEPVIGVKIELELLPELILALLVPPLIFEAAFSLNLRELRYNLVPILLLAVPGVIITMVIVALLIASVTSLPISLAMVFGALIAATDPVAVIALFRTLRVPKRLAVMIEGESLLNDGTAIVVFNVMLGIALTNHFSLGESLVDFVQVVAGGLAVGLAGGLLVAWIIAQVDNHLIETTLTTVLAFGAYLIAERLHYSGVLAVVAAGLVNGNFGSRGMSPTTRIILTSFWEYFAFLANSFIFLLIGVRVNIAALLNAWQPILWAIVAVVIARVIVVYGVGFITRRFTEAIPINWQHVFVWGGLRGAISLALVLSLPSTLGEDRDLLTVMAFGVVLFTLYIQGSTIGPLLRRLKIISVSESGLEYERRHARLSVVQAGLKHLDSLHQRGLVSAYTWESLKPALTDQASMLAESVRDLLREDPELAHEDMNAAQREILRAQRSALLEMRHEGLISDETLEHIGVEIDTMLSDTGTLDLTETAEITEEK